MRDVAKRGALLLALCALFTTESAHAGKNTLQLGTFNIRWFGSEEHDKTYQLPTTKLERISAVKDFLAKEMLPLDVAAFQEIVDLAALKSVLPKGWKCASYKHPFALHQHVAVCASANYKLAKVPYDNDGLINELAYYNADRARPAIRVDVVNKDNQRLLRVVGVHLKSAPHFALLRLKQVGMIGRDLKNDPNIPMVVMGDFNTFSAKQTGLKQDDVDLINNQLNQSGAGFRRIGHLNYTFRSGNVRGQFDHFYVNRLVTATSVPQAFSVCTNIRDGAGYKNAKHYLRYVSDHCPVRMKVRF